MKYSDELPFVDEKAEMAGTHQPKPRRSFKLRALLTVLILLFLSPLNYLYTHHCSKTGHQSVLQPEHIQEDNSKEAAEAFELQLPILYKNLVHEDTILQHVFGDSWGIPAKEVFQIPDKTFNRVVLVLNITVDGIQYDRLAHVFIDDVPVWRTSTAEPGNQLVFSSTTKDITKYLPLFESSEAEVTLKLDNLVTGRLTGAFDTTLSIKYYNEEETTEEEDLENNDHVSSFFTVTSKPAHRVTKLIKSKANKSPLLYYPNDKPTFLLPKINSNTTNLKLALYASGNAAEEFWYSNVLDKNKDIFEDHGHSLLGHGPVRVINVYIDGVRVYSVSPDPVIFTGGISPALWRPIVDVNAFDIKALEIDLTAILPKLWKKHTRLEIEVTNGDSKNPGINSNWILAANLLHWESDLIQSSFGSLESYDNSSYFNDFSISTSSDNLYQTVISNHTVDLYSNLTYNLFNGSQVPLKLHSRSEAHYSNFQKYADYGDVEFLSTVISSSHSSHVYHEGELIGNLKINKAYPLVISIDTEPIVSKNVTFEANVTSVYGSNILIDDSEVFLLNSRFEGESTFTLSPTGNFGFGSSSSNLVANLHAPFPELRVDELAEAVNGTVTRRESSGEVKKETSTDLTLEDVNEDHKQVIDMLVKNKVISPENALKFYQAYAEAHANFELASSKQRVASTEQGSEKNTRISNLRTMRLIEGSF